MSSDDDDDIRRAIASGERNKEVSELIHNWCKHARVQKAGGTGFVEMQTGLPIGHHYMACDHAPAGGMATWDLAGAALYFHDQNCVNCAHRAPVRLPNLSSLLGQRDALRQRDAEARQAYEAQVSAARAARQEMRRSLRVSLTAVPATIVDHLEELDLNHSNEAAEALLGVAELAPEAYTPALIEHCFALLEAREGWFDETGLLLLARLQVDSRRLTRCALESLADGQSILVAASIVERHADEADESLLVEALPALIDHANPEHEIIWSGQRAVDPGPLRAVYRVHPTPIQHAIGRLLDRREPYLVSAGARAIQVLAEGNPAIAQPFARTLVAKLARAHLLLDRRETGVRGDDEAIGRLQDALSVAYEHDPVVTDRLLGDFIQGAPIEGEVRLYDVCSKMLHTQRRRDWVRTTPPAAGQMAIKRLIAAATTSTNDKVLREIKSAFSYVDDELIQVVRGELTVILGGALLLDDHVQDFDADPAEKDFLKVLERRTRRDLRGDLRNTLLQCAVEAAVGEADATAQFASVLEQIPEERNRMRGSMIAHAAKLMETPEGLNAMLPSFYSAAYETSQLVRGAAAKAIGSLSRQRFEDLPELVLDAFILLLNDDFVIVHQQAVDALERTALPPRIDKQAKTVLGIWIQTYIANRKDDRFLLKCIELYLERYASDEEKKGWMGQFFLAALGRVKGEVLAESIGRLRHDLAETEGYAKLIVQVVADPEVSDHSRESLLTTLQQLPTASVFAERAALTKVALTFKDDPHLPGQVVEALTGAGAWEEAAQMYKALYDDIPNTTERHSQKLAANQWRLAALFEEAIAKGRLDEVPNLAAQWSATEAEIEADRAEHAQRRSPFQNIPRSN